MTFKRSIEQQIRQAIESGELDSSPGHGKPLTGLDGPHDEMWWIKQKLRDEGLSVLPPALELRKEVEATLSTIAGMISETGVRRLLGDLNEKIRAMNRRPPSWGPPLNMMPLDIDEKVAEWRLTRPTPSAPAAAPSPEDRTEAGEAAVTGRRRRRVFRGR